nr:MAG TPA: hypothetical protein [Caudoviricetes sp.]
MLQLFSTLSRIHPSKQNSLITKIRRYLKQL